MKKPFDIEFPPVQTAIDQNEEFFFLKGAQDEKIQFHDYERIYKIPGLYEALFHDRLKCDSPAVIKNLLYKQVSEAEEAVQQMKILDFGAGNGLVAQALKEEDPEMIVGVDILEEAKEAAMRDRPEVYEDYVVEDLGEPSKSTWEKLESYDLNAMVSVAALGFDHIPPDGFINAFNLIEDTGWIAINLRDKFLTKEDDSGFKKTLDWIADDYIDFKEEETYVHRLSVSGEPIHYTAIVGKKVNSINLQDLHQIEKPIAGVSDN
jgi:SAM-dependent methyltransferase